MSAAVKMSSTGRSALICAVSGQPQIRCIITAYHAHKALALVVLDHRQRLGPERGQPLVGGLGIVIGAPAALPAHEDPLLHHLHSSNAPQLRILIDDHY